MKKITDSDLNNKQIKILCYRIRMLERFKNNHYKQKPYLKFGLYYQNWKNKLNEYDDIIFNLYNELSQLISYYD